MVTYVEPKADYLEMNAFSVVKGVVWRLPSMLMVIWWIGAKEPRVIANL